MRMNAVFGITLSAMLAGCSTTPDAGAFFSPADQAIPGNPTVTAEDRGHVTAGNTAFGVDLYRRLREDEAEPNLFFSPVSISSALAMTYAGARGETAAQMADTLHFTLPPARIHPAMGALSAELEISDEGRQVAIANALWAQEGTALERDFLDVTDRFYEAGVYRVDYRTAAAREQARETINGWVEDQTNDRIRDLVSRTDLSEMTRLVLTNAVYMLADWERKFSERATQRGDFAALSGDPVTVDLMAMRSDFRHLEGSGFQALELPYSGGELSMVVFLPDAEDGLPAFERRLRGGRLDGWLRELHSSEPHYVDLRLPRFRAEQKMSLARTLQDLGMPLAFDEAQADFFGISGPLPDGYRFVIGDVIHQAFVAVDEEGTEAAAATAVVMPMVITGVRRPEPIVFHADHPFVYVIRDNRSGMILFMGRLAEPASAGSEG